MQMERRSVPSPVVVAAGLAALALLSGCGQKGPLTLPVPVAVPPSREAPAAVPAAPALPASAASLPTPASPR